MNFEFLAKCLFTDIKVFIINKLGYRSTGPEEKHK